MELPVAVLAPEGERTPLVAPKNTKLDEELASRGLLPIPRAAETRPGS